VWNVDCLGNPTAALGQVVGTATAAGTAVDGDLVVISGICTEDVTVTQNRLTITNHLKLATYISTDGVQGQLEIAGAKNVLLNGILLGIASGTFSFNDPGDAANLLVHDGAMATVQYCEILNGPLNGVELSDRAVAEITNTTVSGNGTAGVTGMNNGIKVTERSTLILGGASQ